MITHIFLSPAMGSAETCSPASPSQKFLLILAKQLTKNFKYGILDTKNAKRGLQ